MKREELKVLLRVADYIAKINRDLSAAPGFSGYTGEVETLQRILADDPLERATFYCETCTYGPSEKDFGFQSLYDTSFPATEENKLMVMKCAQKMMRSYLITEDIRHYIKDVQDQLETSSKETLTIHHSTFGLRCSAEDKCKTFYYNAEGLQTVLTAYGYKICAEERWLLDRTREDERFWQGVFKEIDGFVCQRYPKGYVRGYFVEYAKTWEGLLSAIEQEERIDFLTLTEDGRDERAFKEYEALLTAIYNGEDE